MKMQTHQKLRLISEATPDEFLITTVRISDVVDSTHKFFDDNFRGAIITEDENECYGYTVVSTDGLAYFFKVLLNAVFGESVVRVSFECNEKCFKIKTKWRYCREISDTDRAELERTARLSGFILEFSESDGFCHANLTLPLHMTSYIPIYARSEFKMHQAYIRVFFLL